MLCLWEEKRLSSVFKWWRLLLMWLLQLGWRLLLSAFTWRQESSCCSDLRLAKLLCAESQTCLKRPTAVSSRWRRDCKIYNAAIHTQSGCNLFLGVLRGAHHPDLYASLSDFGLWVLAESSALTVLLLLLVIMAFWWDRVHLELTIVWNKRSDYFVWSVILELHRVSKVLLIRSCQSNDNMRVSWRLDAFRMR